MGTVCVCVGIQKRQMFTNKHRSVSTLLTTDLVTPVQLYVCPRQPLLSNLFCAIGNSHWVICSFF